MKGIQFIKIYLLVLAAGVCLNCKDQSLFLDRNSSDTGIEFENHIKETPDYNILTYEYFYNGGGVAVGDLNNDGLADVYLSGNQVPNKLFLNKGNFQFEDITSIAKITEKEGWKTGVTFADVNGDGLLDVYVSYSGNAEGEGPNTPVKKDFEGRSNQLFINQGTNAEGIPLFEEKAKAYGLDAVGTFTTQAYFMDYDLDGDLDVFLLNHANKFYNTLLNVGVLRKLRHPYYGNKLFENRDNTFVEVSEKAGILGSGVNFGLSAAISDLNQDGYPDIYVTNDYEEQDFFYLHTGNGTFKEVTDKVFSHLSNFGMGSDVADLDNDLLPDLFVADMWPEDNYRQKILKGPDEYNRYKMLIDSGYHYQYMRNTLQLNKGTSPADSLLRFSEIGEISGVSNTDWSWAPLLADYNNDGHKDIFITNGFLRDFSNLDFLNYTVNDAVKKAQEARKSVDLAKLVSEMPSTKVSNYAYKNIGNLHFENVTEEWGLTEKTVSNAAAYADLDNDGDLDLIVNNLNAPVLVYENTSEENNNNYLKIKFKGEDKNTYALGTKVILTLGNGDKIFQEVYFGRGYQSSVEPVLTIGLGKTTLIKQLEILWPSKKKTTLTKVSVNQTLMLSETEATEEFEYDSSSKPALLKDVTTESGLDFSHIENDYVDFQYESLIPYQVSRLSGNASVADVNGDGNDDVFFEGAKGQSGYLYLGTDSGKLISNNQDQPWLSLDDTAHEDAASLFFDADGDGDLDLYIVSGGNEEFNGDPYYQDRLYVNDGTGSFSKAENALPDMKFSGGVVKAADYDKDGDLDLFVGGRVNGGNYPMTPRSNLLKNESTSGNIKFTVHPNYDLYNLGMVTEAVWEDIDKDSYPDLIVVGEWMPISVFMNTNGELKNETQQFNLGSSNGWWHSIAAEDFDNDGDTDFLLGNLGLNTQFNASEKEPMRYYIQDIDNNGRIDPILTYYIDGVSYPLPGRDELLGQVASLKKLYSSYESYAKTSTEQLLKDAGIEPRFILSINNLHSSYLMNNGDGSFVLKALPDAAQISPIMDFVFEDFNGDGKKEVLAAGNLFPFRVNIGRMDASSGMLMHFSDDHFTVEKNHSLWLDGDVKDLNLMHFNNAATKLLVTRNDDAAGLYQIRSETKKIYQ